jgi:hypothetical protein
MFPQDVAGTSTDVVFDTYRLCRLTVKSPAEDAMLICVSDGVVSMQVYLYYQNYKSDLKSIKLIVSASCLVGGTTVI